MTFIFIFNFIYTVVSCRVAVVSCVQWHTESCVTVSQLTVSCVTALHFGVCFWNVILNLYHTLGSFNWSTFNLYSFSVYYSVSVYIQRSTITTLSGIIYSWASPEHWFNWLDTNDGFNSYNVVYILYNGFNGFYIVGLALHCVVYSVQCTAYVLASFFRTVKGNLANSWNMTMS